MRQRAGTPRQAGTQLRAGTRRRAGTAPRTGTNVRWPTLPRRAATGEPDPSAANVLITLVACAASVIGVLVIPHSWDAVMSNWGAFLLFALLTLILLVVSVPIYDRGAFSFSGSGMLAMGFLFGAGAAMALAAVMGI